MHFIVLLESKVSQARRSGQSQLLVLNETHILVAAELKVGPLLVDLLLFAVNHLLDFLVLNMRLDDSPRPNSLRITELGGRSSEVLVDCADFCRWLSDKFISSMPVASRYRLALLDLVS